MFREKEHEEVPTTEPAPQQTSSRMLCGAAEKGVMTLQRPYCSGDTAHPHFSYEAAEQKLLLASAYGTRQPQSSLNALKTSLISFRCSAYFAIHTMNINTR